jgi:hypothetical protein
MNKGIKSELFYRQIRVVFLRSVMRSFESPLIADQHQKLTSNQPDFGLTVCFYASKSVRRACRR